MTIEKLKVALKMKLREICVATLFLMGTIFASLIFLLMLIWLSPSISLKEINWGSAILGSILGQVTILVALTFTKKKTVKNLLKRVEGFGVET